MDGLIAARLSGYELEAESAARDPVGLRRTTLGLDRGLIS